MKMGILNKIMEAKKKFKSYQKDKSEYANVQKATELKRLREERIRLEGKAKLEKLRQQERARIEKAKATVSPINKIAKVVKGLQKTKNNVSKSNLFSSNKESKANDIFGKSENVFSGKQEKKNNPFG